MNLYIERPYLLYFAIPTVIAFVFTILKYIRVIHVIEEKNSSPNTIHVLKRMHKCFILRTVMRFFSALMMIFAVAGISYGTESVTVQKSGRAVSFVFDISYSMNANDVPGYNDRLSAVQDYAKELLSKIDGTKVSVVLAKGIGNIAVPLTDDYSAVESIIDNLSPSLMTAEGTSLGNGINAAVASFPSQSSDAPSIWLFTDCEETDNSLKDALKTAVKKGCSVYVIGFGSEFESEILTGDKKTKVKTALRSSKIKKMIDEEFSDSMTPAVYCNAFEKGAAAKIISSLDLQNKTNVVAYETKNIKRHRFFICLSIIFFVISFFFGEFDSSRGKKKIVSSVSVFSCVFLLTGCGYRFKQGTKILSGKINWTQHKYQLAVADFLEVTESTEENDNMEIHDYALLGLGTTYLMQGENDSAMKRFAQIRKDASNEIRFSLYYNEGIIAYRNGDYKLAAEHFKNALLIDAKNTDAKINLELSQRNNKTQQEKAGAELIPVSENKDDNSLESALYSVIREDEQKQWKNQQKDVQTNSKDY
ncbi:MAG: VWA domain-containing protein [Treponema sp.]|nr:VWA domain-containing protein [Treponema sp.]